MSLLELFVDVDYPSIFSAASVPDLAARFGATAESIIQANPGLELAHLQVGQALTIPIPAYAPAK